MRGAPDIGLIKARDEVEAHENGYRGVIVIVGQGRWQTPTVETKSSARILLDNLRERLKPKAKSSGFSEQQERDIAAAIAGA